MRGSGSGGLRKDISSCALDHLMVWLFVVMFILYTVFLLQVPRERDPQDQFKVDGGRDDKKEVHKYSRHAQVFPS